MFFHSYIYIYLTIEKKLKLKQKGKEYLPRYTECFSPNLALSVRVRCCKSFEPDFSFVKFINQVPWFARKTRILVMTPLMVMSSSSIKPVLVLSFDFGLTGSEPSLVGIGKSTIFPHTLSEACLAHKTR